ncbi:MAG: 16S rRNA (guanine(527)-N(7))-methyltransferase RsmG [Roseovarius sp.]
MMAFAERRVSRETSERLDVFEALVRKWNPAINLVSKASLPHLRDRHINDSAQLVDIAPDSVGHWVDIGSGGGFPGVVIAILMSEASPDTKVTLVESDQRKAAFLRTALRETAVDGDVICARVEGLESLEANILSARALGDLCLLLPFAEKHLAPAGVAIFPKGRTWQEELEAAKSEWNFECRVDMNKIEPDAAILSIQGVSRA